MPKSYTTIERFFPDEAHAHAPAAQYARNAHAVEEASVRPAARTNPAAHASGSAPGHGIPTAQEKPVRCEREEGSPAGRVLSDDACAVVYRPTQIADELRRENADDTLPRVLVVATGKTFKRVRADVADCGLTVVVPHVGDRRLDAHAKTADAVAPLEATPHIDAFSNAYAVLACARACDARAVLLCAESAPLAGDRVFLAQAAACGMSVFTAGDPSRLSLGWAKVRAPKAGEDAAPQDPAWTRCHSCSFTFPRKAFAEAGHACPRCGTLLRLNAAERIDLICDEGTFEEWDADMPDADPLSFAGYREKIASVRRKTGAAEAVRTGTGAIEGVRCAFGFMDSSFLMGSMGATVGEKIARLFDRACEKRLPVVIFCASGGARMQEGLASLMQMAKTSCARARHDAAGLLYVSVLTDPTTGGVTASFAMQGDVILAEPGALIGFAGQRVIRDTIKQELPPGFQTAEFALDHGLIDAIVKRDRMRDALADVLALHVCDGPVPGRARNTAARVTVSNAARRDERALSLLSRIPGLRKLAKPSPRESAPSRASRDETGCTETNGAWESVLLARNVHRPTALFYLDRMVEGFVELHGDRAFADDAAIVGGVGWMGGRAVTVIAQEKGSDLKERIKRNFGCPQPEGYRKSLRLMKQAEKFGRPVVCIVDTQGAFCGTEAEERGQGNAIADNLACMAALRTPIASVLIGEGGSGGALALAVANHVAMQEHAVYSVLSPEGFASILWKDRSRAPEAAAAMRMSAREAHEIGVVDAVLSEGRAPAHENPEQAALVMKNHLACVLDELSALDGAQAVAERQRRFARF